MTYFLQTAATLPPVTPAPTALKAGRLTVSVPWAPPSTPPPAPAHSSTKDVLPQASLPKS